MLINCRWSVLHWRRKLNNSSSKRRSQFKKFKMSRIVCWQHFQWLYIDGNEEEALLHNPVLGQLITALQFWKLWMCPLLTAALDWMLRGWRGTWLVRSLIRTALLLMNECCRVAAARLCFRSHKLKHFVLDNGQLLLLCWMSDVTTVFSGHST